MNTNMIIRIYHNNRCGNSRKALQLIQELGLNTEVRNYLNEPLKREELESLLQKLQTEPMDVIRTKEEIYKNHYGNRVLKREEALDALLRFPVLMQRPVVEVDNRAIIARPPERLIPFLREIGMAD